MAAAGVSRKSWTRVRGIDRASGTLIPVCKKIIKNYGLSAHKISYFGQNQARVVTGVAIDAGKVSIPFKRQRVIRVLHEHLLSAKTTTERDKYRKALIGQYRQGAPLDGSFRRRAQEL